MLIICFNGMEGKKKEGWRKQRNKYIYIYIWEREREREREREKKQVKEMKDTYSENLFWKLFSWIRKWYDISLKSQNEQIIQF